jgi:hypothetical protein
VVSGIVATAVSIAAAIVAALYLHAPPTKTEIATVGNVNAGNATSLGTAIASEQVASRASSRENVPKKGTADDIDALTEDLSRSATGIEDWVLSAANDNRWAGLDRDAQAALATATSSLPFDLSFSIAEE